MDIVTAESTKSDERKIHTETIGDVRVQVLSSTLVRLEVKGPKGFEDRETFHIVNRDEWLGDRVTRSENEDSVLLETSSVIISIKKDAKDLSAVYITDKTDKFLWKYTGLPGNKVSLPKANEAVSAFAIADTPRIVPAEWGFEPQPDNNTFSRETNGWDLGNDAEDMYIFLPRNNHKQLRKDFVNLTGKTDMLPLSTLGAWDSRYHPYTEETALAQIDGYHSRNLPLDVLVVDTDWRDASSGMGYELNDKLFPDMKRFIQKAHEKNVQLIYNDHPEPTRTGNRDNNVLEAAEIEYRSTNLKNILELGVDAWWYDRNWAKTVVPLPGFTHEVMGMAVYADAFKEVYPDRRLFMMSNLDGIRDGNTTGPSNIAAHRYSVQWTGDTIGGQEIIELEIRNAVERGEIGLLPYVSADLCSHQTMSDQIADDEYLRWMQFGALSPIFRPHVKAGDPGRMPWLRGEEVTDIYRDYLNLRYRLLPVFYQLSNENYETGMPMTRAMTFDSPEYAGADRYDQYMLGEDILVAPVVEGGVMGEVPAEWLSNGGAAGLKAEYFNNKDLSGTPVLTKTEQTVNFDWGMDKPYEEVNGDNFSARYTGKITNKSENDIVLVVRSDDGCRLYIDGELGIDSWVPQAATSLYSTITLKAGKTYSIKLEYYDGENHAVCQLGYANADYKTSTLSKMRTVFIPEGEWINTINGATVYGPQTISIQSEIQDMPIFIKKGAVIPLADEMLTVQDKDWSHLTLDVYPSTRQSDRTVLYEDDTVSNDYKDGLYRTTSLKTGFKDGKATLSIGAAQGDFSGEKAFDDRDWTIRVHRPAGWGELEKATLNGGEVEFKKIAKDANAMPLVNKGGATDGDVYEITMNTKVADGQELVFYFSNAVDPEVPSGNYEKPSNPWAEGEENVSNKPVTRTVVVADKVVDAVNLTEEGTSDWYLASYGESAVRKIDGNSKIKVKMPAAGPFNDYHTKFSWSDGDNGAAVNDLTRGLYNTVTGTSYEVTVNAGPAEQELNLYIGLWNATGVLEVYDDSSSGVVDKKDFRSTGGKSEYYKVTIKLSSEDTSKLHMKYTLTGKDEPGSNTTFVAATLKSTGNEISQPVIRKTLVEREVPETANLSEANADWIFAGEKGDFSLVRKDNVEQQIDFNSPGSLQFFNDYNTKISWNDGNNGVPQVTDTTNGVNHVHLNQSFEISVPSNKDEKVLTLYLSGWQSESVLEVYDESNELNKESFTVGNMDGTYPKKYTITFSSDSPTTLHVKYTLTKKGHDGANSSFVAATLTQENSIILNSRYEEGNWTGRNETIFLSSSIPADTEQYQVKINDGDAVDISGNDYLITDEGANKYEFFIVNKSGELGDSKSIVVSKDSSIPELNLSTEVVGDQIKMTPSASSTGDAPITIYYRANGCIWIPLDNNEITIPENDNVIYRFKAVGAQGNESDVLAVVNGEITEIPNTEEPGKDPEEEEVPKTGNKTGITLLILSIVTGIMSIALRRKNKAVQ